MIFFVFIFKIMYYILFYYQLFCIGYALYSIDSIEIVV